MDFFTLPNLNYILETILSFFLFFVETTSHNVLSLEAKFVYRCQIVSKVLSKIDFTAGIPYGVLDDNFSGTSLVRVSESVGRQGSLDVIESSFGPIHYCCFFSVFFICTSVGPLIPCYIAENQLFFR